MKFCPYMREGNQVGFSFSINKQDKEDSTNKVGFIIGFTFPEARLLRHDLETFLDKTTPKSEDNQVQQNKKPDVIEVEESDLSQESEGDDEMPW